MNEMGYIKNYAGNENVIIKTGERKSHKNIKRDLLLAINCTSVSYKLSFSR